MAAFGFRCDGCGEVLKGAELSTWEGHTFPILNLTGSVPQHVTGEMPQTIEKYDLCTTCFRHLADTLKMFRKEAAS